MKTVRLVAVAFALCSSVTAAFAQGILLRLKPTVGTAFVYKSTQKTTMEGQPESKATVSTTTMKVIQSDDKVVKLSTTVKASEDTPGASDLNALVMEVSATPLYKLIGVTSTGGGEAGAMLAKGFEAGLMMSPSYPEKSLQVGDTWTMPVDFAKVMEGMGAPGTIRLVGETKIEFKLSLESIETDGDKQMAHIKMVGSGKLAIEAGGQQMDADLTLSSESVIDVATGMATLTTSTIKQVVTMAQGSFTMTMNSTTKLETVK